MQRFQHLSSQLLYHMLHRDFFIFSRHIHIADKEILFLFPLDLQQFHIFVTPVHAFTDINPGNRIQKLKSALDCPFQQCSGKFAGTACQIIRCNLCRTHIRSPQSDRKTVVQIQQHFRDMKTGEPNSDPVLLLRFPDQIVTGTVQ